MSILIGGPPNLMIFAFNPVFIFAIRKLNRFNIFQRIASVRYICGRSFALHQVVIIVITEFFSQATDVVHTIRNSICRRWCNYGVTFRYLSSVVSSTCYSTSNICQRWNWFSLTLFFLWHRRCFVIAMQCDATISFTFLRRIVWHMISTYLVGYSIYRGVYLIHIGCCCGNIQDRGNCIEKKIAQCHLDIWQRWRRCIMNHYVWLAMKSKLCTLCT